MSWETWFRNWMDDVIICTFSPVFYGSLWRHQCSERGRHKENGILHIRIWNSLPQLPRIGVLIICYSFLPSLFRLLPYLEGIQRKYLLFTMRAGTDSCNHKVFVGGNRKILITHSQFLPSRTNLKHTQLQLLLLNPLNPELNPICCLVALLGANHFPHVSTIKVKSLTLRLLMSYIYIYIYIYIYTHIYIWSTHSWCF